MLKSYNPFKWISDGLQTHTLGYPVAAIAMIATLAFISIGKWFSAILCFFYYLTFRSINADITYEQTCNHELTDYKCYICSILIWKGKACTHCTYEDEGSWFP